MTSVVPEPYHGLAQVVLVAYRAQARGAQQKELARRRFEPQPAAGKHSQEMAARKKKDVSADGPDAAYHRVRPSAHLLRRLATRTTIAEQLPARPLRLDLSGAATLVLPVIPFN